MSLAEVAEGMLTATIQTKRGRCVQEHGPTDLMPVVHIITEENQALVVLVPDRDFIDMAVDLILPKDQTAAYIGWCGDAYLRWIDNDAELPEHGDLRVAREAGDMTVIDAIVVAVVEVETGTLVERTATYTYDDWGQPVFSAPNDHNPEDDIGVVSQTLRAVAARCRG